MKPALVTPVGTCRIHAPLRRARGAYAFQLETGGVYGFIHSTAEALQLVRY